MGGWRHGRLDVNREGHPLFWVILKCSFLLCHPLRLCLCACLCRKDGLSVCLSGFKTLCFPLDCVHQHLCMHLHFYLHACGRKNQLGLLLPLICVGELLFWSRDLEGWMFVQAANR